MGSERASDQRLHKVKLHAHTPKWRAKGKCFEHGFATHTAVSAMSKICANMVTAVTAANETNTLSMAQTTSINLTEKVFFSRLIKVFFVFDVTGLGPYVLNLG